MMYINVDEAVLGVLHMLQSQEADTVIVKGMETKELLARPFTVFAPEQRVCLLEGRNGNIFAQIAETLWMLYGRDDLDWLERYIPQCKKWSDNGETWRAAYGPRLRRWPTFVWRSEQPGKGWLMGETDQVAKVVQKLRNDPHTRQAVISLWDPASDWIEDSRDYPCNQLLHFIIRNDMLHLNVSVRSNDIIYGFSHIDFFGWSVLQQLIASWIGVGVGHMFWNATSMHLYKAHYNKAQNIIASNNLKDMRAYPQTLPNMVSLEDFDDTVRNIFDIEDMSRNGNLPEEYMNFSAYNADLLTVFDYMLRLYNFWLDHVKTTYNTTAYTLLLNYCAALPDCDMRIAAITYFKSRYNK